MMCVCYFKIIFEWFVSWYQGVREVLPPPFFPDGQGGGGPSGKSNLPHAMLTVKIKEVISVEYTLGVLLMWILYVSSHPSPSCVGGLLMVGLLMSGVKR